MSKFNNTNPLSATYGAIILLDFGTTVDTGKSPCQIVGKTLMNPRKVYQVA
jgi:hypothetical protein